MKKQERARFKLLKRKEKNNELDNIEEIKELAELYQISSNEYMKLALVFNAIALLGNIFFGIMKTI